MRRLDDAGDMPGPGGAGANPLSDIFFGCLTVILSLVFVLLPAVQSAKIGRPPSFAFQVQGHASKIAIARADSLLVDPEGENLAIPLGEILRGAALGSFLRSLNRRGEVPLVLIRADGQEAMFLFEARASREGVPKIAYARLPDDPSDCSQLTAAGRGLSPALCRVGRSGR